RTISPRRLPQRPPLPYTTLFRSETPCRGGDAELRERRQLGAEHPARRQQCEHPHDEPGKGRQPDREQRAEGGDRRGRDERAAQRDRKSTRLNSSHVSISYAVFCL